jgi:hypothetical protein
MPIEESPSVTAFHVKHVCIWTTTPFDEVVGHLRALVGVFDADSINECMACGAPAESILRMFSEMVGPSGFMSAFESNLGAVLGLQGEPTKAVRFLVGNALIMASMLTRVKSIGLYTPLSILIWAGEHRTCIEYDRPSSLLGQFRDSDVLEVALDEKLSALASAIAA